MELKKIDFVRSSACSDVMLLGRDRYDEYAVFHDKYNPDIYWNSERIFDSLDLWKIHVIIKKQKIVGSIFIRVFEGKDAEIFGISVDKEYESNGIELKLLSESIYDIFAQDKEKVLYFVEEDAVDKLDAALMTGFKKIDNYRCYKVNL